MCVSQVVRYWDCQEELACMEELDRTWMVGQPGVAGREKQHLLSGIWIGGLQAWARGHLVDLPVLASSGNWAVGGAQAVDGVKMVGYRLQSLEENTHRAQMHS